MGRRNSSFADGRSRGRSDENGTSDPQISGDVNASELDSAVRQDLRALDGATGEKVTGHLVMVSRLLGEDPELALAHARAARARAARVGVVRETAGIAAYFAGEWHEALTELRAARRITGDDSVLPLMADCERGLGRPERAVEIGSSADAARLRGADAVEMTLVVAGAQLDLGEPEAALATLERSGIAPGQTGTEAARLYYVYATALEAAGRRRDAVAWFQNAAAADDDDVTDAELRVAELVDGDEELLEPRTERAATTESGRVHEVYDTVFFDLDGTLFAGATVLPGSAQILRQVTSAYFVTNNASRSASEVAEHLRVIGLPASAEQIVTSAEVGSELLTTIIEPGAKVLVIGAPALAAAVSAHGFVVVSSADERPDAVIQGLSKTLGWAELSEAVLAVSSGAKWIACNRDTTLPDERGLLLGNGALVAAVAAATGKEPVVAGKPAAPIMRAALARSSGQHPLMIGDRLDTDIAGARGVDIDALISLTGVSSAADVFAAAPRVRPTHIVPDLTYLDYPAQELAIRPHDDWQIIVTDEHVQISGRAGASLASLLPTLTHAVWTAEVGDRDLRIAVEHRAAAQLLVGLGLTVVG